MARELYDDKYRLEDEFDSNQALIEWIGLPNKKEKLQLGAHKNKLYWNKLEIDGPQISYNEF